MTGLSTLPVLGAVNTEPSWTARLIFFGLTALAAGMGCLLGDFIWLVVASRFVSRERPQRNVHLKPQHERLGRVGDGYWSVPMVGPDRATAVDTFG